MPLRPDLRDGILHSPTIKEARRYAMARQKDWRSDWNLIRHSVLIAGLGFLALDRPDLKLGEVESSDLIDELQGMKLPERFASGCVQRFKDWAAGPSIGSFGANTAPDAVVGRKFSKSVQNKPSWTLVSLCNNKTAWRLHDWALAHYVPVRYIGQPSSRTSSNMIEEVIMACDQVLVFEVKGGKNSDRVIKMVRSNKKQLSLELYQPEETAVNDIPD